MPLKWECHHEPTFVDDSTNNMGTYTTVKKNLKQLKNIESNEQIIGVIGDIRSDIKNLTQLNSDSSTSNYISNADLNAKVQGLPLPYRSMPFALPQRLICYNFQ